MNKGVLKRIERKKKLAREKQISKLPLVFFLLGSFCLIYSFRQYHVTIINYTYILFTGLITGITTAFILGKYISFSKNYTALQHYVWVSICFGGIVIALLFLINKTVSSAPEQQLTKQILERNEAGRRRSANVVVGFDHFKKEINLHHEDMALINSARSIVLITRRGFFGIDFITCVSLSKE